MERSVNAMKVLGIITEYNPFHNGHLFHLEESRKLCAPDYTVCVMSGNFIQRGEPAIINKWARTRMALLSGVDLVLELPFVYAASSAEFFAFGGVRILDGLGVVSHLCFGSENGRTEELEMIADVLLNEPPQYRSFLKSYLDKGLSFPAARERALCEFFKEKPPCGNINTRALMGQSNNILGIEYIKAIKKLNSKITPLTIKRAANTYSSEKLTGAISSATSIRKHISGNSGEPFAGIPEKALPISSLNILKEELECGRGPVFMSDYEDIILYSLRRMPLEHIREAPYISEGLENRIKDCAMRSGSLGEFMEKVCTRRYTMTRIQRSLLAVMMGLSASELDIFNNSGGPRYIKVLGFNEKGRKLLSEIKRKSSLPVIVKTANFKKTEDALLNRMLEIEAVSTDLYVMGYRNPEYRRSGQEYTQNIVRIKC